MSHCLVSAQKQILRMGTYQVAPMQELSKQSKAINRLFSTVNKTDRHALTHIDKKTNLPKMVDVGNKKVTRRTAHARSIIKLPEVLKMAFKETEGGDIQGPKGPVIATSIIAGTMAVKNTSNMIPFCHPLPIEKCDIHIELEKDSGSLVVDCIVATSHKTGVEMEALTGASVASLCVYDMCKAMSHDIVIADTRLLGKTGGKSDYNSKQSEGFQ